MFNKKFLTQQEDHKQQHTNIKMFIISNFDVLHQRIQTQEKLLKPKYDIKQENNSIHSMVQMHTRWSIYS